MAIYALTNGLLKEITHKEHMIRTYLEELVFTIALVRINYSMSNQIMAQRKY